MSSDKGSRPPVTGGPMLKLCRWCGGPLAFEPSFPVLQLVPGTSAEVRADHVPPALRTLPAWVCATPFCKYREMA